MVDFDLGNADRKTAEQQFRQDIKKHIKDISTKYIIPGETSDGALMFIPAEAIFAEIHGHYPRPGGRSTACSGLVDLSNDHDGGIDGRLEPS